MTTNIYSNARFSLISFIKQLGLQMTPPVALFVDLDAHAEIDKLPKQDFVCLSAYSMQMDGKEMMIFAGIGVGVWNDPDMIRLATHMNVVVNALLPEKTVPLWTGTDFSRKLIAADDLGVPPSNRSDQRLIQQAFVRLMTIPSAAG